MKAIGLVGLALAIGCSSSTTPGTPPGSADAGGTAANGGGGTSDTGCTITFGGDAAGVTASSCTLLGPNVSDATDFTFSGSVTGLDSSLLTLSVKYPNSIALKTYETKDLFYVSANLSVSATGKAYFVDFDAEDATKTRHGTLTTTFTSQAHGTIEAVYDTEDPPIAHATVKVTF